MESNAINKMTVDQVLKSYPESVKVFIQHFPVCIGCAFDRFCSMEDVAKEYGIPLIEFINLIEVVINRPKKGSDHEI